MNSDTYFRGEGLLRNDPTLGWILLRESSSYRLDLNAGDLIRAESLQDCQVTVEGEWDGEDGIDVSSIHPN